MFVNKKGAFTQFAVEKKGESALNEATRKFFTAHITSQKLVAGKAPAANLKQGYYRNIERGFIVSLFLLIIVAQISRTFSVTVETVEKVDLQIEVADIPPTQQFHRPPPPPRPSIPVPSESEDIPEDLTIASTEIDLSDIPPPPAPPADDMDIFIAYDEPPKIKGGMKALLKHLRYPRVAQSAGMEGIVFLKVLVGTNGTTERVEVIKAKPANMGFEESAIEAIKKVKWKPAKQREKDIRVWVSIPVQFKLVSS